MLLVPQVNLHAFEKWAINLVGIISLLGKKIGARYIITTTDYLTRWAEAQLVNDCNTKTTTKFIFEYILSKFVYQKILMSDQGTHFLNKTIKSLTEEFQVYH